MQNNQAELKDSANIPYPCYLKPAISVDGGWYLSAVPIREELENALIKLDDNMPIQVQARSSS